MKQTLKKAGYTHKGIHPITGEHILKLKGKKELEAWFANKNHAGFGLIYKNTHLEFGYTIYN